MKKIEYSTNVSKLFLSEPEMKKKFGDGRSMGTIRMATCMKYVYFGFATLLIVIASKVCFG